MPIAATGEVADMSLEYLPSSSLGLEPGHLPQGTRWPQPAQQQRWPFGGGLVDYIRPVGPGVYVGAGWKTQGRQAGKQFLHFVMSACD